MRRGAVYWVDFDPVRGGEIRKWRPAVIVSNDAAIEAQSRVQVVPLISNTARIHRWEALIYLNGIPQKALADQIRTVAKERLVEEAGLLAPGDLLAVERAIRVQLGLL
jgi:mRNA interferase MazF